MYFIVENNHTTDEFEKQDFEDNLSLDGDRIVSQVEEQTNEIANANQNEIIIDGIELQVGESIEINLEDREINRGEVIEDHGT